MFEIPEYNGAGIYAIFNINNKNVYVGSSRNIKQRALSHRCNITSGTHGNPKLREDSKAGHDFAFIILEKAGRDIDLLTAEDLYMLVFVYRGYTLYNCDKLCDIKDRVVSTYVSDKDRALNDLFESRFGTSIGFLRTRCTKNLRNTLGIDAVNEKLASMGVSTEILCEASQGMAEKEKSD